jgi:hypothetical protein
MDALAIFIFIVWFWLLITVFADLFRRHDISGWIKAIWGDSIDRLSLHCCPRIFDLSGKGMAERNVQQAQQARDELRRLVSASQMKSKSSRLRLVSY